MTVDLLHSFSVAHVLITNQVKGLKFKELWVSVDVVIDTCVFKNIWCISLRFDWNLSTVRIFMLVLTIRIFIRVRFYSQADNESYIQQKNQSTQNLY